MGVRICDRNQTDDSGQRKYRHIPDGAAKEEPPNDIVAEKDGRITSIVTRNGVPLVKPGDEVKKGDILVSGKVEVKNDAGEVVNYHYQNADADIEAETTLEYENEHRFSHSEKKYTDAKKKLFISRSETISAFWEGGRTIIRKRRSIQVSGV